MAPQDQIIRLRRVIAAMEQGAPPPVDPDACVAMAKEAASGSGPASVVRPGSALAHAPPGATARFAGRCGGRQSAASRPPLEALPALASHLPLGEPRLDAELGGGLRLAAVHDAMAEPGQAGALSAFALGLAARAVAWRRRPVLFVQQELAGWEAGGLYGPGLAAFGLSPSALVRVARAQDVLFAMEEGLRCAALSAVLGEFPAPFAEALTATRRVSLAAREGGVRPFGGAPSAAPAQGLGRPHAPGRRSVLVDPLSTERLALRLPHAAPLRPSAGQAGQERAGHRPAHRPEALDQPQDWRGL